MSDINVKDFNDLVQSLKKMLWGVQSHKNDSGFPRDITEEAINELIGAVEKSRAAYELNLSQTKPLRDAYHSDFSHGTRNLSRFTNELYEFYGKQSPLINQFGLKPPKDEKPGKRKPVSS
jgi:hypothetical protein